MSCNGCRVLRKGCSDSCTLRTCLQWIPSPIAQANATLFLSRFFGRSDLLSRIAAVPDPLRPAVFQSLLYEACGRVVNPVNGVVGLLATGKWHVCQEAVNIVLVGGTPRPVQGIAADHMNGNLSSAVFRMHNLATLANHPFLGPNKNMRKLESRTKQAYASGVTKVGSSGSWTGKSRKRGGEASEESEMTSGRKVERKLLKLFV